MTNQLPDLPTRAQIRATATEMCDAITRAAAEGRNPHQLSIDQLDQAAKYAESLGPEHSERYLEMLSQEIEAISADTGDRRQKEAEKKLGNASWLIGAGFGALIGLPILFRACS